MSRESAGFFFEKCGTISREGGGSPHLPCWQNRTTQLVRPQHHNTAHEHKVETLDDSSRNYFIFLGMIIYLSYGIRYSTQNEAAAVDNNGASYMELTNSVEDES